MVERLLFFIVPTQPRKGTPGAAQGVEFVNKNDGWRHQPGLLKQVAHARRAHTHKHLDKLAARDREKRHPGLPRHGFGQQGFAGARRPHQQHAFGNVRAQAAIFLRMLQKIHHLFQLVLGLVHAGHVGKGDAGVGLDIYLGAAFANRQKAAHALLVHHAPNQEIPQPKQQERGHDPRQNFAQPGVLKHPQIGHVELFQARGHIGFHTGGHQLQLLAVGGLEAPDHGLLRHGDFGNATLGQRLFKFAVGHDLRLVGGLPEVLQEQQHRHGKDPIANVPGLFFVHSVSPPDASHTRQAAVRA